MKAKNLIAISVIAITMLISTINISTLNQERSSIFSLENVFSKALADIEIPDQKVWRTEILRCGEFEVGGVIYYYHEVNCYQGNEDEECIPESCPV